MELWEPWSPSARDQGHPDEFLKEKSADAEDDDGFVVEAVFGALKARDVGEDGLGDFCSGQFAAVAEKAGEAILSVHLLFVIFGIENSIGDKDDGIAGLGGDAEFLVGDVGEHAQGKSL